jgi:hypothetical protein
VKRYGMFRRHEEVGELVYGEKYHKTRASVGIEWVDVIGVIIKGRILL